MNKKIEEMIALGVAYGINCITCMEYHEKLAIEAGLTKKEMLAAITIARQVKEGAAKKTESVARKMFDEGRKDQCCSAGNQCC